MHVSTVSKPWTIEELDRLPDDGNRYELIDGELYVTPPPSDGHETIAARLTRILDPYVAKHGLGLVYRPRAVIRSIQSQVEPDLMVRQPQSDRRAKWESAPVPILVVEILSPYTWRRDRMQKRDHYMKDVGVAEYWIVDREQSEITQIRPDQEDVVTDAELTWAPIGASEALTFDVPSVFE